jgi:hypothetical protein
MAVLHITYKQDPRPPKADYQSICMVLKATTIYMGVMEMNSKRGRFQKRFGYQIRSADNRLVQSVGGFATREYAEKMAGAKREEIKRRGWNMTVHVTEAHLVSGRENETTKKLLCERT